MSSLQLSGLASGFDWKSFVDQIVSLERSPATRMQSEISSNQLRLTALSGVESRINDLRSAVAALGDDATYSARTASVSGTGWSATASSSAASGTYVFDLVQRATSARWNGAADIASPLAATNDVSGLTLAALGTAAAPTAGEITVNGARVAIDLADSLQDVFDKISTATADAVTASYSAATDRVTLSGSGAIVLGSATDSSNLLSVLRLANNGTPTVSSSSSLGAFSTTATLAGARLATAVTAVDAGNAGSFSINGVNIAYDLDTDSLSSVLARINASAAGVTASHDPAADRVSLVNNRTGDIGFALSEAAGGLLGALGLTSAAGATLTRGDNARFTVNDGAQLTSTSNRLDESAHGIAGLVVTPSDSGAVATVTVGGDGARIRSRIDAFVSAFNSLQTYIDGQTKVTSSNGKVTSATLAKNREVQRWATQLRSAAFAAVPGLDTAIARLDHLGIDFNGTDSTLAVKDSAKLDAGIRDQPAAVAAFFQTASSGFAARFDALFDSYVGPFGSAGLLGGQRTQLTNSNTSLTQQIADLDRRLEQRRAQLESGFIAMERAQSLIQQMQSQITRAFPVTGSNK